MCLGVAVSKSWHSRSTDPGQQNMVVSGSASVYSASCLPLLNLQDRTPTHKSSSFDGNPPMTLAGRVFLSSSTSLSFSDRCRRVEPASRSASHRIEKEGPQ